MVLDIRCIQDQERSRTTAVTLSTVPLRSASSTRAAAAVPAASSSMVPRFSFTCHTRQHLEPQSRWHGCACTGKNWATPSAPFLPVQGALLSNEPDLACWPRFRHVWHDHELSLCISAHCSLHVCCMRSTSAVPKIASAWLERRSDARPHASESEIVTCWLGAVWPAPAPSRLGASGLGRCRGRQRACSRVATASLSLSTSQSPSLARITAWSPGCISMRRTWQQTDTAPTSAPTP